MTFLTQEYLCDAVLPVYHADRIEFRRFMKRLCPKLNMRHRKFYRKKINAYYLRQKMLLKKDLKDADWVCTTADAWSTRRKSYIGVTAHWLSEDLKRKSACLAVKRIRGKATYDVIAKLLEDIHDDFDITRKLTATITDNGSNFIKAFKVFGLQPDQFQFQEPREKNAQTVPLTTTSNQNVMDDGMNEDLDLAAPIADPTNRERRARYDGTDTAILAMLDDLESDYQESSEDEELPAGSHSNEPEALTHDEEQSALVAEDRLNFISLTNVLNDKEKSSEYFSLPTHRRCACHTLNLIAKEDVVKNMEPALKNLMTKTDRKIGSIWKKQSRSSKASDAIFDNLKMLFVIHNETRWNSYYDALERVKYFIVKRRDELKKVFEHFKQIYFRPTEEDFIKEYIKIMGPVTEALDILQADKKISIGYLLPTLSILMKKLEVLKTKPDIKHCKSMINTIMDSVKKRFQSCFTDQELIVAALVHPKFKTSWLTDTDKFDKIELLTSVYNDFKNESAESMARYIAHWYLH